MILSHRHKFIFFKQMKSAGSSIELALTPFCGTDDILTGSPYEEESSLGYQERNNKLGYRQVWHQHVPPEEFFTICGDSYNDYLKFTTIRNPYDAIVSYFWWAFYSPDTTLQEHVLKPCAEDRSGTLKNKFSTFLQTYAQFNTTGKDQMVLEWFSSRYDLFYNHPVDHILKYEQLDVEFSGLCGRIGLGPINLPHLKHGIRKSPLAYQDYYDVASFNLVSNYFKNVLDNFGYNFND